MTAYNFQQKLYYSLYSGTLLHAYTSTLRSLMRRITDLIAVFDTIYICIVYILKDIFFPSTTRRIQNSFVATIVYRFIIFEIPKTVQENGLFSKSFWSKMRSFKMI